MENLGDFGLFYEIGSQKPEKHPYQIDPTMWEDPDRYFKNIFRHLTISGSKKVMFHRLLGETSPGTRWMRFDAVEHAESGSDPRYKQYLANIGINLLRMGEKFPDVTPIFYLGALFCDSMAELLSEGKYAEWCRRVMQEINWYDSFFPPTGNRPIFVFDALSHDWRDYENQEFSGDRRHLNNISDHAYLAFCFLEQFLGEDRVWIEAYPQHPDMIGTPCVLAEDHYQRSFVANGKQLFNAPVNRFLNGRALREYWKDSGGGRVDDRSMFITHCLVHNHNAFLGGSVMDFNLPEHIMEGVQKVVMVQGGLQRMRDGLMQGRP